MKISELVENISKKRIRELKGNNYNVFCAQENAEMN